MIDVLCFGRAAFLVRETPFVIQRTAAIVDGWSLGDVDR